MLSVLFFFLFFALFIIILICRIVVLSAEHTVEKCRECRCTVREVIILTAVTVFSKIAHLLGKVIRTKLFHKLRHIAVTHTVHEGVHLILNIFKVLVRDTHFADKILNRLDSKLFCTGKAITCRRGVFGIII